MLLMCLLLWNLAACGREKAPVVTELTGTAVPTEVSTEPETEPAQAPTAPTESPTEPTQLPTEPQEVMEPADADFVKVIDYIPDIRQALAYATVDNFAGQRIYDFTDAYLRYGTVKKLAEVCEELAGQGLGLLIWDGFRPVAAQAKLWEICPDATYVSHPVTGNRSHCRGSAVDVTLVDLETGEELPVPTGFDNFTKYADRDYSDCSEEAAANARLLEDTMEKYGFKPYSAEWWHFSDTEAYPVEEYFDPAVPTLWDANCEEYISLRAEPDSDGETVAKLPAGDTVKLLSWSDKYGYVQWNGLEGYVMTSYIRPSDASYFEECLDTVKPTNVYAYEQMLQDLADLEDRYSQARVEVIGTSELGRDIPVLCIGDEDAKYHVLVQGAIHGREHLTAWLIMAMADYWLDHGLLGYGNVCYHLIPMSNPDGVVTSQTGALTQAQREIYESDRALGYTELGMAEYAEYWKANGLGVDINRNFPSGWDQIDDRTAPSAQRYRGEKPFSAAEARALKDYTLQYDFDVTISYHATGSVIYYEYGEKETVNSQSESLAEAARQVTGYSLAGGSSVDGAGYKDWAIEELEIPSLTIEVGCQEAALAEREIYSIFARNYRILPAIARWLQI